MADDLVSGRVYTTADLAAIAGSTTGDVAARRHNGTFKYGKVRPGTKTRFYTLLEVILFSALQHLIQRGIGAKESVPLAQHLTLAALEAGEEQEQGQRAAAEHMSEQARLLMMDPDHRVQPPDGVDGPEFICIYQPLMSRGYKLARIESAARLGKFLSSRAVHTALTINTLHFLIDIHDRVARRMEDLPEVEVPPLEGFVGKMPDR